MLVKSKPLIFRSAPKQETPAKTVEVVAPKVRARLRPDWKRKFLVEFAKCGVITMAARAVGVDRSTVVNNRNKNPKFAADFERALQEANDVLEAHALQLATVGQSDPLFMRDKDNNPVMVFDRKRKSERILELMLKSRMPHKFRENISQELTGPGGAPLVTAASPIHCTFVLPQNNRRDPIHMLQATDAQAEIAETQKQLPQETTAPENRSLAAHDEGHAPASAELPQP